MVNSSQRLELGTWLDTWLESYKRHQVQPTTYENYKHSVRRLKKHLGKAYLMDTTTEMVQGMINEMNNEGLTRSIKLAHCTLNAALKQAVRNGMIPSNPAEFAVLPRQQRKEAAYLSEEDQRLFIKALEGKRLAPLFMFQLATGLRPGEVKGLKWEDVDFDNATLTVSRGARREEGEMTLGPTKTKREREIELLDEALVVLEQQKAQQEEDKAYFKEGYMDNGLIFANRAGGLLDDSNTRKVLKAVRKEMLGLKAEELELPIEEVWIPPFTPHSLRHTFATRALEKDIPLKVVADWLGHSTIRITGDTYSHATSPKRRSSMNRLQGILSPEAECGQKRGQTAVGE
ncbi:site-specific integrase [Ruminococcaceae bacterium OttesenSCG-928-D13]|nr:site-specific integrase [Ruminococcaceae bacterium OttesenSCG-928-D13]